MVRIGGTFFCLCINIKLKDLFLYSHLNTNLNHPTLKASPSHKPSMPTTFQVNTHPLEPHKLDHKHERIISRPQVLLTEQFSQLQGSTKDINMQNSMTNEEFSKMSSSHLTSTNKCDIERMSDIPIDESHDRRPLEVDDGKVRNIFMGMMTPVLIDCPWFRSQTLHWKQLIPIPILAC